MFFCVVYCSMSHSSCDIMAASAVKTADVLSRLASLGVVAAQISALQWGIHRILGVV